MIDYEYFLSRRFDFVVRYYILQESNFERGKTGAVINNPKHSNIRDIFTRLLRLGGNRDKVAKELFLTPRWHWVDQRIKKNQKWINKNPYEIKLTVIGGSVKRFFLPLLHKKTLPWTFMPKEKEFKFKLLWKEEEYEKMLETTEFNEIKKSQLAMMERMEELNFFSLSTYIGEEDLLEEHKQYIQTQGI